MLFSDLGLDDNFISGKFKHIFGIIMFFVPLLSLFPFIDGDYGSESYGINGEVVTWCFIREGNVQGGWGKLFIFIVAWTFLLISDCLLLYVIYQLYKVYSEAASNLLQIYGIYPIITTLCWIVPTYYMSSSNYLSLMIGAYINTFANTILFIIKRKMLHINEARCESSSDIRSTVDPFTKSEFSYPGIVLKPSIAIPH